MPKQAGAFRKDLARYYEALGASGPVSRMNKLKLYLGHYGLHCVAVYRFGRFSRRVKQKLGFLALPLTFSHNMINALMKFFHHVDIEEASIGPGFLIYHVGTIYIGPVTIGENFSVTHNVTIGVGLSKTRGGLPALGDNVWIGTGSVIYGEISIGDNVIISSGSILSRNIPDNCLVAGNPARVLSNYGKEDAPSIPANGI